MRDGNLNYRVINIPQPLHIQVSVTNFKALLSAVGLRRVKGAGWAFSDARFWVFWVHLEIKRVNPKTTQTSTDLATTLRECLLLLQGSGLTTPFRNLRMKWIPQNMWKTGSWGCKAPDARRVLCTCKKLEVYHLPGHAGGWWQDVEWAQTPMLRPHPCVCGEPSAVLLWCDTLWPHVACLCY